MMLMKSYEQMKYEIVYYLNQNGVETSLDNFNNESIAFFYSCLNQLCNSNESVTMQHNDWREEPSKYGREFLEGSLSITPPTAPEILDSIIKWGKVIQEAVASNNSNVYKAKFIFNVFSEIPKFLKHIKIIRTKEEQCIFYQIGILGKNNPNNLVSFNELKNFEFSIIDSSICPYDNNNTEKLTCLFWENGCKKKNCSNSFDDNLVRVLQQLKEKGVIKIDFTINSVSII